MARPLKAASVTTKAGRSTKPRITVTMITPRRRCSRCGNWRGISVRSDLLERARRHAQQRQHHEAERQACHRHARGEREIEASEAELIDEVRDHVDLAAADQLRGRE